MKATQCCASLAVAGILTLLNACAGFSVATAVCQSWQKNPRVQMAEIELGTIKAEGVLNASAVENEIERLMPLLFFDCGQRLVKRGSRKPFILDVIVSERGQLEAWQTNKSLTVELCIQNVQNDGPLMPLMAVRCEAHGEISFSSSQILFALLSRATNKMCQGFIQAGLPE